MDLDLDKRIDTVVFDLGGVLVDWNPRYLYRQLIEDEREIENFLTNVCHGDWNQQQDAGRPFEQAIRELAQIHPDKEPLIRAYFERWPEMISGSIAGTVEILRELKSQKTRPALYALTNWSHETFPIAKGRFPFLDWFDGILVSGVEKMIKPDPKFYGLLSSRFGVEPSKSIFIDDVEKNVRAARECGFEAVLFTTPEGLRTELIRHGVLSVTREQM